MSLDLDKLKELEGMLKEAGEMKGAGIGNVEGGHYPPVDNAAKYDPYEVSMGAIISDSHLPNIFYVKNITKKAQEKQLEYNTLKDKVVSKIMSAAKYGSNETTIYIPVDFKQKEQLINNLKYAGFDVTPLEDFILEGFDNYSIKW